jgi:hypothetical protein
MLLRAVGSEPFRADQCVNEIDKHAERHEGAQGIVEDHGSLLEPIAGEGVDNREDKKSHTRGDENGVKHGKLRSLSDRPNFVEPTHLVE